MPRFLEFSRNIDNRTLKQLRAAGIKAVSKAHWSKLTATAVLMEQPEWGGTLQVHERIAQLEKSLTNQTDKLDSIGDAVDWASLIQPSYQKWQAQQRKCFNDPEWWSQCFEKIQELPLLQRRNAKKRLRRLQKRWALHGAYAHYSTLDVIHIYQTILPIFAEWLKDAKIEFEKRKVKLTSSLKTGYESYLEWFETALQEEQQRLRGSLQERLVVGLKKGYGAWDHLIESLQAELNRIGGLAPTTLLDKSLTEGHLTPEAFVAMRRIIEADGNDEEKNALHALAYYRFWFDKDHELVQYKKYPLHRYQHHYLRLRNDTMSFKSTVYPYLPRFLQWFFWDEAVHAQFFQHPNPQFLLAQEAAFLETEVDVSDVVLVHLFIHPVWQESALCLKQLQNERQRIEQWLAHPLAFLFPDTISQLEQYRKTLEQSANRWIGKQLRLLKQTLECTEHDALSVEDKAVLTSILVDIQEKQKQWTFSKAILAGFLDIKRQYQALCDPRPDEVSLLFPEPVSQPLPVRDEFRESVKEAIKTFEATQDIPNLQVQALKEALPETDALTYDSVALRIRLVEQLEEKKSELPSALKDTLETILDNPKFEEKALNRAENAELRNRFKETQRMFTELTQPPIEEPIPELDEDPWDYDEETLKQHCEALKRFFANTMNYPHTEENHRLCRYTLRFLEHIQNLPDWEAFLLHRAQIKQFLRTVVEISVGFSALHQALIELATGEEVLNANRWNSFIRTNLSIQIGTLGRFINRSDKKDLTHHNAVSYWSQRTLLKAPAEHSALKASFLLPPTPISTL